VRPPQPLDRASLVALPVAFVILSPGPIEPNAASGAMGALLAFVLLPCPRGPLR
jgi:hypothetical protein